MLIQAYSAWEGGQNCLIKPLEIMNWLIRKNIEENKVVIQGKQKPQSHLNTLHFCDHKCLNSLQYWTIPKYSITHEFDLMDYVADTFSWSVKSDLKSKLNFYSFRIKNVTTTWNNP